MTAVRDEDRAAARAEVDRETIEQAASFPTYEVPEFVLARFPTFDPSDPQTWPEPDRCTDGRPWGHNAYSWGGATTRPGYHEDRWRRYLAAVNREASCVRSVSRSRDLGCRNRWKHDDSRLCGVHDRPWRDSIAQARRAERRRQRVEENLDLARRLGEHGIEADGSSPTGVVLAPDAVRTLLDRLTAPPVALHGPYAPTPDTYTE